jgi:hypothetical protein
MRKSLVALLLSMGVTAFAANLAAAALNSDESIGLQPKQMNAQMARELYSRAARLQTSATEVDTVYVGFTPGHGGDNYWSIWSGSDKFHPDGQWHRPPARGGMWDWEPSYTDVKGDSLQGWTPYRMQMTGTGGLTIDDWNRPWRCLDYGNNASHVIPGSTRTHGVVGVWHVDAGNTQAVPASVNYTGDPTPNTGGVGWAPLHDDLSIAGVGSAWMGLRRHGDNTHTDAVARGGTGNPFNEDVLLYQFDTALSSGGTDKKFPGYGAQMDQMLYRDIDVTGVTNLTVAFSYRTSMSTSFTTNNLTRSGWFQFDPLAVITGGGNPNFFASTGNPTPPVDSFMVYVGSPAESSVVLSDGNAHLIFDKKRRWFGEVLRGNEGLYKQILSVGGTNAATAFSTTLNINAYKSAVAAGVTNKVRLVFRVKTNQAFDDEFFVSTGYSSGGVGAAIVDNVVINKDGGAAITLGHFDNVNQIDNRTDYGPYGNVAHATHPLNVWKSTGKPPAVYAHVHPIDGRSGGYAPLVYQDLCGQPGNPARICDLDNVHLVGRPRQLRVLVSVGFVRHRQPGAVRRHLVADDQPGRPGLREPYDQRGRHAREQHGSVGGRRGCDGRLLHRLRVVCRPVRLLHDRQCLARGRALLPGGQHADGCGRVRALEHEPHAAVHLLQPGQAVLPELRRHRGQRHAPHDQRFDGARFDEDPPAVSAGGLSLRHPDLRVVRRRLLGQHQPRHR